MAELILGAPGTGKTRALLNRALDFLKTGDPARMLVLTPSRVSATRFREALTSAAQTTMSSAPMRAWQAYAFDVLRRAHIAGLLPGVEFSPKLLSGPEQDVLIAELLAGHARGEGAAVQWPTDLQEALGTQGFRHELRDFFDRMVEYNLSAEDLASLAEEQGHPEWAATAKLYTEYRQIRRLRMPNAYDPAALINEACDVFEKNPSFLQEEQETLQLILIDDMQEATPSIYRLLNLLCSSSYRGEVVISLCTDTAVQGFRGARPDSASRLREILPAASITVLDQSYRMPPEIARAWESVAVRIPVVAGVQHSRDLAEPVETEPEVQALWETGDDGSLLDPVKSQDLGAAVQGFTVDSPQSEARLLAQLILEDHLYRGRAFSRSAIIVRNGSAVTRFKRVLQSQGIPVKTAQALTPVRDEPAVRPFLDALGLILHARSVRSATETGETDAPGWGIGVDVALALLTSRLGGASAMDIRRLRQGLRAQELRSGGNRASDDLLVEALMDAEKLPAGRGADAARRVARVLAAGDRALDLPGATAETVLWELWETSGLAPLWKEASGMGGSAAERAHRDLDAIIGLFEAASRYVDQMPGATAAQFLDYIDAQDLPMDTLAARAAETDAVEIMTPAVAAGRGWDIVYIAGLQEGTWPNTTIRGSLLNTQTLIDILDLGADAAAAVGIVDRLKATRFDELRMFSTAVSRASFRLVCTAVSSADDMPSELLDMVAPAPGGERANTPVRRPMTLRAMIAELRQFSEGQDRDPARAAAAAQILHRFNDPDQTAGAQLPGAHPASWWGMRPLSSDDPTFDPSTPVPVSPSRVEAIHSSPLDWFVAQARAEAATDMARSIGTLVHELAEDMPDWKADDLNPAESFRTQILRELEVRFQRLGLPDTWETQVVYQRAVTMVEKFVNYVVDLHGVHGRELVGVEGSFKVFVPGPRRDALLSGRVDRLEKTLDQGKYVIVDLKTGKSSPTRGELEQHPQLASYQVALEAGAGQAMEAAQEQEGQDAAEALEFRQLHEESGGAYLVQIGKDTKKYGSQEQQALSRDAQWAVDLINRAAELISAKHLEARHDSSKSGSFGKSCRLPEICPLCTRGRQVTQS